MGGSVFATYALDLLEKGGRFDCHQLVVGHGTSSIIEPVEKILEIPRSIKTIVDKVSTDQTLLGLYVPKTKKNDSAIDAWIPGLGAFQVTIGSNYAIRGQAAKHELALLGDGANKLYYYWLIPPLY